MFEEAPILLYKLKHTDRSRSIVIDASNKCSLQCPKCERAWYLKSKKRVRGNLLTLDQFKKIVKYYDNYVEFCGQISDVTMNPNLPDFLTHTYDSNILTRVSTAASYRSSDWYVNCFKANPYAEWIFGIDGLPDQSHIYRKGQDGQKLFDIMSIGASMGIRVVWQYIVFKYNQDNIESAKQLAKKHNILFELNLSSRWDSPYDPLKPIGNEYVKHITKVS